jgi:membrane associated rhomboid family serine protease
MKKTKIYYPTYSITLIIILFVATLITSFWNEYYNIVLLRPLDLNEYSNWYRYLSYPLYVSGLNEWFWSSLSIFVCGGILESRSFKKHIIYITLLSTLIGGVIYTMLNQNQQYEIPMGSPHMISYGFFAAAFVIGIKNWKELRNYEKIILVLGFIGIIFISRDNLGFYAGTMAVIGIMVVYTLVLIKKTGHNTV